MVILLILLLFSYLLVSTIYHLNRNDDNKLYI